MAMLTFLLLALATPAICHAAVNTTTCANRTYTYRSLAGFGSLPSSARDKYGDTLGSIGSAVALAPGSWAWSASSQRYTGVLWAAPDRGWNTNGTLNYAPRIHKFALSFCPNASASPLHPAPPNLVLEYLDSILYTAPDGAPLTGLDADAAGAATFAGFPDLPVATYTGDGFGREGPGGRRVALDAEGLVVNADGSFWVSDEYGPYIYKFSAGGEMLEAIRPPDAYIPTRNGSESFSAASPPIFAPSALPHPTDPTAGRSNNQGFEGLTLSPSGRILSALLQSALVQDGGASKSTARHARLVQYDVSVSPPLLIAEYVVALPLYDNADGKERVAAQSAILALSATQFLVLARDSGAGRAQAASRSRYRQLDVFDVGDATNILDLPDANDVDAAGGAAALYCPWLDFNVESELARFGLRNGRGDDAGLLDEKWEGVVVLPVLEGARTQSEPAEAKPEPEPEDGKPEPDNEKGVDEEGEYYILAVSDNDFITQDGHMGFGGFRYADASGADVDTQALVFRVGLPEQDCGE
ncbi:esterase-like activity of phytase-domain-containing protein [Phyllosticta capitalensis]|uniref:esterase-like activity of phytase-domain-containing protein n=1 Tax=Phyllosticta capitalensis TaxID=121624 RepID=UPI0031304F0D